MRKGFNPSKNRFKTFERKRKRPENMGKEGELWDDSALIDAFDNAMFKYKKMHGKKNSEANVSVVVDQSDEETIK
ncbi:hypothetical protein REPUB_Repub07fG0240400 [Reevesia pubescens]